MIINALSGAFPEHVLILTIVHRLAGLVGRLSDLLGFDAQLFAAARAQRVHHQEYQVAMGDFLHAKRSVNTERA